MIHVVAAVIFNTARDQVLIARRPEHLHMGGLWEFPGGKVMAGEEVEQALTRELAEELNIWATQAEPLMQVQHCYLEKTVLLDFWQVTNFTGSPQGIEGQVIRWVGLDALSKYDFPAGNRPILAWINGR